MVTIFGAHSLRISYKWRLCRGRKYFSSLSSWASCTLSTFLQLVIIMILISSWHYIEQIVGAKRQPLLTRLVILQCYFQIQRHDKGSAIRPNTNATKICFMLETAMQNQRSDFWVPQNNGCAGGTDTVPNHFTYSQNQGYSTK